MLQLGKHELLKQKTKILRTFNNPGISSSSKGTRAGAAMSSTTLVCILMAARLMGNMDVWMIGMRIRILWMGGM